jgi:hypothetical protein
MPVTLNRLVSNISRVPNPTNAILIERFLEFLKNNDTSGTHQSNSVKGLIHFANYVANKYGPETTLYQIDKKEQIVAFLDTKIKPVQIDPDKIWIRTWNDYLEKLTYFFRWLYNIEKPGISQDTIPKSSWETPNFIRISHKKTGRESPYTITQVWEQDEFELVVGFEKDLERRAAMMMLWDLNARNHEVAKIAIENIRFKEGYAEGEIPFNTKTGGGPFLLTASFSAVLAWYNKHPFKHPKAKLICSESGGELKPDTLRVWLYKLRSRIQKMLEEGGVKDDALRQRLQELILVKKWNPYCIRHSSISCDSDILPGYALNKKVRWTMNSRRPKTYIKRKIGKDLRNTLLAHAGIIPMEAEKLKRRIISCQRCNAVNNPIENRLCEKCGYPLTIEGLEQLKAEENQRFERLEKEVKQLTLDLDFIKHFTRYINENRAGILIGGSS